MLILTLWINVRSKLGWAASIVVATAISADLISQRLQSPGQSAVTTVLLFFVLLVAVMTAIWLLALVGMLLMASVNLLRRGAIGPRTFTISAEAFTEDNGYGTTAVSWRHIRSIDKTRRHIFVRISRWKYLLLSARDFQNEYLFAQYYADLVKARHENT